MEPTTGLILRRITQTDLSVSAHKLATLILDGIAWKDGYNGLPRGTAAFTLGVLADRMNVSRQHLNVLLSELEASPLRLQRRKPHGKYAPWLFRFAVFDDDGSQPGVVSDQADTSLCDEESHKTVFTGQIRIGEVRNVFQTGWADRIKAAKAALPCWNVDTQVIWDRFLSFNRARGNEKVPAGFLLGFMRKWRTSLAQPQAPTVKAPAGVVPGSAASKLQQWIAAAPTINRQFHAADLSRLIGRTAYETRISDLVARFACPVFTATLAVHGRAVIAGEIGR